MYYVHFYYITEGAVFKKDNGNFFNLKVHIYRNLNMLTRLQVIKCDPSRYKGVSLKLSNSKAQYTYFVDLKLLKSRDLLLLISNIRKNTLKIINKAELNRTIEISL